MYWMTEDPHHSGYFIVFLCFPYLEFLNDVFSTSTIYLQSDSSCIVFVGMLPCSHGKLFCTNLPAMIND